MCVSTQNVPKVVEGKSQGNNKTTLRKGAGFFLYREGSLIDFYQVHIYKQNKMKFRSSLWLKQGKHKLGYGVTNIHELQDYLYVNIYKGKVALGYSQIAVCLVIKKERDNLSTQST